MIRFLRSVIIELAGLAILAAALYFFIAGGGPGSVPQDRELFLPSSVLTMNTIFLSIVIEAVPFVLIGVLIAGMIQIFVTEDHVRRWIPNNRFLALTMSCVLGALFPACECGIVPIVRRLVAKGVPLAAGVGFLLTGPLINPIVIASTYMAFGNDGRIAALRMILGFSVALVVAFLISVLFRGSQLKREQAAVPRVSATQRRPIGERIGEMFRHAIDEFFDMGKYLILGAFLAAFVQTYVSAKALLSVGEGTVSSTLVMMALAYLLSLCSEADAFIAASFRNLFSATSLLGFLVYGPMIDLKNTLMLLGAFRVRFVLVLIVLITVTVFAGLMAIHAWI